MQNIKAELDGLVTNLNLNLFFEAVDNYLHQKLVEIESNQRFTYSTFKEEFISGIARQDRSFSSRLLTFYQNHIKVADFQSVINQPLWETFTSLVLEAEQAYQKQQYKNALKLYEQIDGTTTHSFIKERITHCRDIVAGKIPAPVSVEKRLEHQKNTFENAFVALMQAEDLSYAGKFTEALPTYEQALHKIRTVGLPTQTIEKRIQAIQNKMSQQTQNKENKEAYDKRAEMMWDRWTMGMYIFRAVLISFFLMCIAFTSTDFNEFDREVISFGAEKIIKLLMFFIIISSTYRIYLSWKYPVEYILMHNKPKLLSDKINTSTNSYTDPGDNIILFILMAVFFWLLLAIVAIIIYINDIFFRKSILYFFTFFIIVYILSIIVAFFAYPYSLYSQIILNISLFVLVIPLFFIFFNAVGSLPCYALSLYINQYRYKQKMKEWE